MLQKLSISAARTFPQPPESERNPSKSKTSSAFHLEKGDVFSCQLIG